MGPSLFEEYDLPQNFWFVRTEGGKYYREFTKEGFIAINWNDFSNINEILMLSRRELKVKVKEHYEQEKRPGCAATQMQTFVGTMKKGDIVLIPNTRSREIAFGIITSDAYIKPRKDIAEGQCPFMKRRNIDWLKTVPRNKLDPYLYSLINSHHSITNAYKCRNFINRTLFDFYGTDEETHMIFNVTTEEPILTSELRALMNCIYGIAETYNELYPDATIDIDDIAFKASVNSPGPIELIAKYKTMFFILSILYLIVGGNIEYKDFKITTPGLFGSMLEAYKEYNRTHLQEITITKKSSPRKCLFPKPLLIKGMLSSKAFQVKTLNNHLYCDENVKNSPTI